VTVVVAPAVVEVAEDGMPDGDEVSVIDVLGPATTLPSSSSLRIRSDVEATTATPIAVAALARRRLRARRL
jgi:hypothetical protein